MENGHEWVDLGLPSGLKWATCNVGADSPCDFGNYFCWAGVTPVIRDFENDILLGSEFVYFDRGAWRYTKYVTNLEGGIADNKYRLEPMDDAASVNWGGKWRMPTKADFIELKRNCRHKWVTDNGVSNLQANSTIIAFFFLRPVVLTTRLNSDTGPRNLTCPRL